MPWTFRRDLTRPLVVLEFDGNTDMAKNGIEALQTALAALGVQVNIASFDFSVAGFVSVTMSDATVLGPYAFDTAIGVEFTGPYAAGTNYVLKNWFTAGAALYEVIFAHTAPSTFDPNANDGLGHNYYRLVLNFPAIPSVTRSGSSFAPSLSDANTYNRCTNTGGCTVTLQVGIPFPIDSEIHLRQCAAGAVSVIGDSSDVIINVPFGFSSVTAVTGAVVTLKKVAEPSTWDMFGLMLQSNIPFAGLFADTDTFHAPVVS